MSILLNGNVLMIVAGLALFAAVMFVVIGIDLFVGERRSLSRRLAVRGEVAPTASEESNQPHAVIQDDLLKRFADFVTPKDPEELAAARKRLVRAGYRSPSAIRVYNAAKPAFGLGFALLGLLLSSFLGKPVTPPIQLLITLVAGMIGFFMPFFWVERRVERRREEAELAFPDMLDMILICIEAGSGIDQAARRVANEVAGVSPVLAEELAVVNAELWAGKQRAAVFRDFADRLGVQDIRAFATVLKQSDEFGVSIAEALRVYAADMRLKRIMRAEEKANTMPTKVALGSVAFTVPPTMVIMSGPSFVVLMRMFGAMH